MNENDKQNLQFLLSANEQTLRDWYSHTTDDDHEYAMWLLSSYSQELRNEIMERIEVRLENSNFLEATKVLAKFRKNS